MNISLRATTQSTAGFQKLSEKCYVYAKVGGMFIYNFNKSLFLMKAYGYQRYLFGLAMYLT